MQQPERKRLPWMLALVATLCACAAEDENPAIDRPPPSKGDDVGGGPGGPEPGTTPLRRLTKREYVRTVQALLGDSFGIAERVPDDANASGFDNASERFSISVPLAEQLISIADQLSQKVDPVKLAGCDGAKGEPACARALVEKIGPRAYRRPLAPAEIDELVGQYGKARPLTDHPGALRNVLTRILVSPDFLYHVEIGEPPPADGSSPPITAYELASRLSYLFLETMPDDALFAAAASGKLGDEAGLASEIDRLVADPRAREAVSHMHDQWLELPRLNGLVKDATAYPGFDAAKDDVAAGTRRFLEEVVWSGSGRLNDLFVAPYVFLNERTAPLYGATVKGTALVRVEQDPTIRIGILGQPALLAAFGKADKSSPILRGVFVRDRILCTPVPPPPPGASTIPPDAPPAKTTRELFARLTEPSACQGCHSGINPIGWTLEAFDGIGRYRTTENGVPVDTSGELNTGDAKGPIRGQVELARRLADSRTVEECVARQWFRFAYARTEGGRDEETISQVTARFRTDGTVIRSLPITLAKSPPFRRLHYTLGARRP